MTKKRPEDWEPQFLAALRKGLNAKQAAVAANIDRSTPYSRRKYNDPFRLAWEKIVPPRTPPGSVRERPRSAQWRRLFLQTLAETSNVRAAAADALVSPRSAYKARRSDPSFRRQWNEALLEGYEHLEMETLQRLRMGTAKDQPKFDIANALRLLALHKESADRQRALREAEDEDAILDSLDAKIEAMRAREEAAARLLAANGIDINA